MLVFIAATPPDQIVIALKAWLSFIDDPLTPHGPDCHSKGPQVYYNVKLPAYLAYPVVWIDQSTQWSG